MTQLKVWDIPVRLFHWGLVGGVVLAFYTMKTDGAPFVFPIDIHARAGYVVLGLLVFRWLWGLVGSHHARFTNFLHSPLTMADYARRLMTGRPPAYAGHNPLGGVMVMVMLVSLSFQAGSGLFLSDDIFFSAPLHGLVDRDTARTLRSLHHLNADLLMILIGAHLLALVVHRLKGERLVAAMVTGRKGLHAPPEDEPVEGSIRRRARLELILVVLAVAALPVLWLWQA